MRKWMYDCRVKKKLTQEDLAEKLGITGCYYSLIENGKRMKALDMDFVVRLSVVFGISIDKILRMESKWKMEMIEKEVRKCNA